MKRQKKKYKTPTRRWSKDRIEREKQILRDFGLKKKREIWRAENLLRKYRRMARELATKKDKEMEKMLVKKLTRLGLLSESSGLDDVLGLTLQNLLDRRLQTVLLRKGLVNSVKQSRQLIVHGHVLIDGKRIVYPSYLVSIEEEGKIQMGIVPQVVKKEEVSQ